MDPLQNNQWWGSSSLKIYSSHVLSSWGDRMWSFAVGLYLVVLFPESLQLTAIYGFLSCITSILMGAFIGKWVDKTERLRAAQISLVTQNTSVIICAGLLIVHLSFPDEMKTMWDGFLGDILIGFVILFAIIANLASVATKLVLEKDWIVVLSGGNETLLSKMNATMRTIDLTTFILAPILVGQIFTYGSHLIGATFIAGWNLISCGFEYYLLILIYKSIPQLSQKMKPLPQIQIDSPAPSANANVTRSSASDHPSPNTQSEIAFENLSEVSLVTPKSQKFPSNSDLDHPLTFKSTSRGWFRRNLTSLKVKLEESKNGWREYFSHPVRNAGIGLALLYMTVLGFDNITTGYAYSQGVSESTLGIMTAVGAVFGILGSISFPLLRKKLGKLIAGNIGFGALTCCLILCLVSIVTPGSPFTHKGTISVGEISSDCKSNFTTRLDSEDKQSAPTISELWNCNISVLLLMFGIISARFGLWVADLSVVQIFQERVAESQRGVLNGVQGALNQTMNLIKFLVVIILPKSDTFAYLIGASWLFIFAGWVSFMTYSWANRRSRVESIKYSSKILTVSDIVQSKDGDDIGIKDGNDNENIGIAEQSV